MAAIRAPVVITLRTAALVTIRAAAMLAILAAGLVAEGASLSAQSVSGVERELLEKVMPAADRFEAKAGEPPVIRAYRGDRLVGFVFRTRDVPPEQLGYSGPVEAVVGLELDGTIAGARVTEYYESYRSSMGDFLRRPGVQEQFTGKTLADPFLVNGDVERVTRATISTQALARGIRDSSRRVAEAYAGEMRASMESGPLVLEEMSWFEMRTRGVLKRILIESPEGHLDISMTHLPDDSIAEFFVGAEDVERIHAAAARWDMEDPTYILYALEGPRLRFFLRDHWHVAQGGDTLALAYEQVYSLGLTEDGRVADESVLAGVFMLDDRVELSRPFDLLYELEGHEGYYAARFEALEPAATVPEGEATPRDAAVADSAPEDARPEDPADADAGAEDPADVAAHLPEDVAEDVQEAALDDTAEDAGEAPVEAVAGPWEDSAAPATAAGGGEPGGGPPPGPADTAPISPVPGATSDAPSPAGAGESTGDAADAPPPMDLTRVREESELSRTFAATDWGRVARMLFVVVVALTAFFLKKTALRYLSLAVTLVVLGFLDGGFLSISHVTAGIWVGPAVYLRDLPLLILVAVTAVTTLIWGRFFCGFLCPFGALQDFMERMVPKRLRIRVPWSLHLPALRAKYLVLAVILVPAVLGSRASLYQWFEPFGTVFFPSRSLLLWAIAGAFLLGAALIPRFYCRYACPLGAGLALVSLVSPKRIGRVEQCDYCKVCEQDCPTGAIEGPDIDFGECVRCNRCETNLFEDAGACRYTMAEIRPRLVQLETSRRSPGGV